MERWARAKYQPVLPMGEDGKRLTASEKHILLSKEAAKEGMVLLKNEENVLPLKKGSRVALFGKATFDYVKGGGGSGDVTVSYVRNLYEGLKQKQDKVTVFEELAQFYKRDVEEQYAKGRLPGMTVEPAVPEELLKGAAAFTDTAIISISRFSGEGWDRMAAPGASGKGVENIFEEGDFYLSHAESAMVEAVKGSFARVIVVLNVGGMVASEWFKDTAEIQSVLLAWQGGMEGGLAAAELLLGEGTPSGRLSDTFAKSLEDYPSTGGFHESDAFVDYTEDIYVGYRYFETVPGAAERVNYPFGYGLSYTRFRLSRPSVEYLQGSSGASRTDRSGLISKLQSSEKGTGGQKIVNGDFRVTVDVCNVGAYPGKEVVQVYYSAPQGKLGKPARELAAFCKTGLLAPGEKQTVTLYFRLRDMASYDDLGKVAKSAYVLEKGEYHFYVGTSVRDTAESDFVYVQAQDEIVEQLSCKLAPVQLKKRMLSDGSFEALPLGEPVDTDATVLGRINWWEKDGLTPVVRRREGHIAWNPGRVPCPFEEVAEGRASIDVFLEQLSDEQLSELLGGQPNTGVANTFGYGNLPEYGVPCIMTADGPAGLRIERKCGVCTTAFPCATQLACTWNPELVEQVGAAGGAEVKENNIGVWLTPAINIHRSPLCGRNFEYYSEDPLLAGKLAAAIVTGIQSNHVAATVKHFALNNKETNRKESDSRASERAIREIYLRAFEIVVREAKPWSIMSSYNIINGCRASENRELLEDILRGEWGFDGMVTTDWWTLGEPYKEVKAGNDMKMGCGFPERLLKALEQGALTRREMEICARRVLSLILKID